MNYQKQVKNSYGDIVTVPNFPKIITHVIIGLAVLVTFFGSFVIIGAGQRGVIITLGKVSDNIFQ